MVCEVIEKLQADGKTVKGALKALGKKNLALIAHGSCFPSAKGEDTGFGTYNSEGGKLLLDYAKDYFNAIQLGPAGKTKSCDSSPYTGTIFSDNPLFIDLKQLTGKEWFNILSTETFKEIVAENPNKDTGKTAYSYIYKKQLEAINEAWQNFQKIKAPKLKEDFEVYKRANAAWLDKDALYEALSIEYNNDYWYVWPSETDKNLFNPQDIEQKMEFAKRIEELEEKYSDEINTYKFAQFILSVQGSKTREYALKSGIKMVADRQVAFSDRDIWAYQSLFLEGWLLGCPPDYFSEDGQAWGFPVLNPDKMYTADGSLDEGGKLLKALYKKMFAENKGGVRIDHIIGLVDPWVYKVGCKPKPEEGAGRLYSSPEHEFLSKFAIAKLEDLDTTFPSDNEKRVKTLDAKQIALYGRLLEKIVIAAALEEGCDKDCIICEDLGTLTNPVAEVMKTYDLQGMRLTQFVVPEAKDHPYRCKNITARSWAMVGTHDNEPVRMWAKKLVNTPESYEHAKNLVEDLFSYAENKDELIVRLTTDAEFLAKVKLVEIFASKAENVQIFFTDFFNINDVYNRPGTSGDENWSLRIPNNFKNLVPINLGEILALAIRARGEAFTKKNKKLLEKLEG